MREDILRYIHAARGALARDQVADALVSLSSAADVAGADTRSLQWIGKMALDLGDPGLAARAYAAVVALLPEDADGFFALGRSRMALREFAAAAEAFAAAAALAPGAAPAWLMLGNARTALKQQAEAIAAFLQALRIHPGYVDAEHNLGIAYLRTGNEDAAIAAFTRALQLEPQSVARLRDLGWLLAEAGRSEEAQAIYARAYRLTGRLEDAWAKARAVPIVCRDEAQQGAERLRYLAELHALPDDPDAYDAIRDAFHVHYQSHDDLQVQRPFGLWVSRIVTARFAAPAFRAVTGPIRVGFVSSCFRQHTVLKLFVGWMAALPRERFCVSAYSLGDREDEATARARRVSDHFVVTATPEELAERILADGQEILIYPEIGMDARIIKMAARRLAPTQCATWGHPVTSGLANVDYFLTSDLMEPPGEAGRYTESVVRLPNLGLYLDPIELGAPQQSRSDFGFAADRPLYICTQSLFKFWPRYDDVIARIAQRVPGSQFACIEHPSRAVSARFLARLGAALAARGRAPDDTIKLLPRLSSQEFLDLNSAADISLDTIGWSGGMTTIEGLACGVVPVTLPLPVMRARHTAAILQYLGVTTTLADSTDGYVDIAVRLGLDAPFRRRIAEQLAAARPRLFGDTAVVAALANFLEDKAGRTLDTVAGAP